ncbi:IS3 family transposase [Desulfovibrio desulfuricans]|uniref:IS3 family transposase n=1 Tax=Desulfovibrio desulfuricans TaxID=876 RepID=UPI003969DC73|nr:IS3 family transposase [Desulfovibrio desulfuricans]
MEKACVESFFSHLKAEVFLGKSVQGKDETRTIIEEYIRFYNTEQFQKRLGQFSPVEYRKKLAA